MRGVLLFATAMIVGFGSLGVPDCSRPATQTVNYVYDELGRMTQAIYDSTWAIKYS